jgi:uncharacterized protein (DUF2164 family)
MESISKNYCKGEPIRNASLLVYLAKTRHSVYYYNWGIKPAAVLLNMQFRIVMDLINKDALWTIVKKAKPIV